MQKAPLDDNLDFKNQQYSQAMILLANLEGRRGEFASTT